MLATDKTMSRAPENNSTEPMRKRRAVLPNHRWLLLTIVVTDCDQSEQHGPFVVLHPTLSTVISDRLDCIEQRAANTHV